jgi:glycerol kinase
MIDRVYADSSLPRPPVLKVDGGAAANDVLMQIQANILGCPVQRMVPLEATGYGAALLAGEACGIWPKESSGTLQQTSSSFEPQWSEEMRNARFDEWQQAWKIQK